MCCRFAHLPHVASFCAGVEGAVIIGKLLERTEADGLNATLGYNAATGEYEDLVKAGIIDPLKVSPCFCIETQLHSGQRTVDCPCRSLSRLLPAAQLQATAHLQAGRRQNKQRRLCPVCCCMWLYSPERATGQPCSAPLYCHCIA